MRGKAKARWIMAALEHMCRSSRDAAAVLARHGARAATDITGFGLIGHLVEMVRASAVDAVLALDRIPVLEAARETIAIRIVSSLQPQNVRLRRAIRGLDAIASHPDYPLLFDPQTAGGLLAAVPAARASSCVSDLIRSGYAAAAVIGLVRSRGDRLEPIEIVATTGDPAWGFARQVPAGAMAGRGDRAHEPVL